MSQIAELQGQCSAPINRTALERLKSYLNVPPKPCSSFHFPMPQTVKDLHTGFGWDETCNNLYEWAVRELKAIDCCFVDVEDMTELCHTCIGFTSQLFRNRRYVVEDYIEENCDLTQWRCIGDEVTVMSTHQTGQWEAPTHELSDLFNRALPPEHTMVYLDIGANGLYVLMETKGMESRLLKALEKYASVEPRKPRKARNQTPKSERSSESPEMLSWLDAVSALDSKIEIFTRFVEDFKSELLGGAVLGVFGEGKGVRLSLDTISVKDAELLSSFPGEILEIHISGSMTDEAATVLASFRGSELELSGVSAFPEIAFRELLKSKRSYLGILRDRGSLDRKEESTIAVDFPLSDAIIKKLLTFKSKQLFLNGTTRLSDTAAKSLSSFKGELLCLGGITDLSEACATAIAACRCKQLNLNGLKYLSPKVAAALANSRSEVLQLNGLETISDTAAKNLSAFKGKEKSCSTSFILSLNGLTKLSNASAKSLSKTKVFKLRLGGLKHISQTGLENLALHSDLELGLESISDAAALAFGANRHSGRYRLSFSGIRNLSTPLAKTLASLSCARLSLDGLQRLSVATARTLAGCSCNVLDLYGLKTISEDVAKELANYTGSIYLNALVRLDDAATKALSR
jgi:hypothetical protein